MDSVRLRLLLVEDDELDVTSVKRALAQRGLDYPLYVAQDGSEALQALREGKVPRDRLLILLDLYMPRMNGLELLKELRQDAKFSLVPVVLLTTSQDERAKLDAYQLNVAGFIRKPVDPKEFEEQLAAICGFFAAIQMP